MENLTYHNENASLTVGREPAQAIHTKQIANTSNNSKTRGSKPRRVLGDISNNQSGLSSSTIGEKKGANILRTKLATNHSLKTSRNNYNPFKQVAREIKQHLDDENETDVCSRALDGPAAFEFGDSELDEILNTMDFSNNN